MELAPDRQCPPHHWEVTTARVGDQTYYHHTCLRCAAQKDLPLYVTSTAFRPERLGSLAGGRSGRPE